MNRPVTGDDSLETALFLYDRRRYLESVELLMPFADGDNAEAQYRLATLCENGGWHESGKPYIPTAMFYHYRAAANDHVRAQVSLAALLEEFGLFREAFHWWERAACGGHTTARCVLGFRYLDGIGAPKSLVQGIQWMIVAADRGHPVAKVLVNSVGGVRSSDLWVRENKPVPHVTQGNVMFLATAKTDYLLERDYTANTREVTGSDSFDRRGPEGKAVLRWTNLHIDNIEPVETAEIKDGIEEYRKGHYDSAYNKLLPFADIGNPVAQFYLGKFYDAWGLDRPYASTAFFYYYCSAVNGCREAMNSLSHFLERYAMYGEELRWSRMAVDWQSSQKF